MIEAVWLRKGMVIFVANVVLYLMAKQNVALDKADVELADVAGIYLSLIHISEPTRRP